MIAPLTLYRPPSHSPTTRDTPTRASVLTKMAPNVIHPPNRMFPLIITKTSKPNNNKTIARMVINETINQTNKTFNKKLRKNPNETISYKNNSDAISQLTSETTFTNQSDITATTTPPCTTKTTIKKPIEMLIETPITTPIETWIAPTNANTTENNTEPTKSITNCDNDDTNENVRQNVTTKKTLTTNVSTDLTTVRTTDRKATESQVKPTKPTETNSVQLNTVDRPTSPERIAVELTPSLRLLVPETHILNAQTRPRQPPTEADKRFYAESSVKLIATSREPLVVNSRVASSRLKPSPTIPVALNIRTTTRTTTSRPTTAVPTIPAAPATPTAPTAPTVPTATLVHQPTVLRTKRATRLDRVKPTSTISFITAVIATTRALAPSTHTRSGLTYRNLYNSFHQTNRTNIDVDQNVNTTGKNVHTSIGSTHSTDSTDNRYRSTDEIRNSEYRRAAVRRNEIRRTEIQREILRDEFRRTRASQSRDRNNDPTTRKQRHGSGDERRNN
nr:MAG: hypothetical protein [Apis mellifera filamentous virus]